MLDVDELFELEEKLRFELDENLTRIITSLNRKGQLEEFLGLMNLSDLISVQPSYEVFKNGKIVVIGQCEVKESDLLGIVKKLGLDKNRFEFYLDYKDAKKFDFKRLQWNPNYALVLVGPVPHSGESKGDYSSVLTAIESDQGYPPVVRLGKNNLNISKSDFKEKLLEQLNFGVIAA